MVESFFGRGRRLLLSALPLTGPGEGGGGLGVLWGRPAPDTPRATTCSRHHPPTCDWRPPAPPPPPGWTFPPTGPPPDAPILDLVAPQLLRAHVPRGRARRPRWRRVRRGRAAAVAGGGAHQVGGGVVREGGGGGGGGHGGCKFWGCFGESEGGQRRRQPLAPLIFSKIPPSTMMKMEERACGGLVLQLKASYSREVCV